MSEEDDRGSRTAGIGRWLAGLMSESGKRRTVEGDDTRDVCQQQWPDDGCRSEVGYRQTASGGGMLNEGTNSGCQWPDQQ